MNNSKNALILSVLMFVILLSFSQDNEKYTAIRNVNGEFISLKIQFHDIEDVRGQEISQLFKNKEGIISNFSVEDNELTLDYHLNLEDEIIRRILFKEFGVKLKIQ